MPEKTTITVPLDFSAIEKDVNAGDAVKVVGRAADGTVVSATVPVTSAAAKATLTFAGDPGTVVVAIGPAAATDDEILQAESPEITIPSRLLRRGLDLKPIRVGSWYWDRWKRQCRTIAVKGKVVCADGTAVPAATVTASDIDWWFLWSSTQQVATATTGPDGTFEMTFRWCCGLFPWWWWFRNRTWQFDRALAQRVNAVAGKRALLDPPVAQPSLAATRSLLTKAGSPVLDVVDTPLVDLDPKTLDRARADLTAVLPPAPELERLGIWPWAPWAPWRDCRPDLVFTVTQDCGQGPVVVVDENVTQARWDVPDEVTVTLVADENACCAVPPDATECLFVDAVCGQPVSRIAGNVDAPAAPAAVTGYLVTTVDGVDQSIDAPFGGDVPVDHAPSSLTGIDYYGFEYSTDGGTTWHPLSPGELRAFDRGWHNFDVADLNPDGTVTFGVDSAGGYGVYETRRHWEDTHFGDWAPAGDRYWKSVNFSRLLQLDSPKLSDGVYAFRVVSFVQTAPGVFEGPHPAPGCDGEQETFTLALDNRLITDVGHDLTHNCDGGVHQCTTEPDTAITGVQIDGATVGPCDLVRREGGDVVIEFTVTDPDGHLDWFRLESRYGNSGSVDLLAAGTLACISGGPDASNYAAALAGGAVRPTWGGGRYRLQVPIEQAFPQDCCYLLRLTAQKRTRVSCIGRMTNVSEMSLGVGV
ncbi:carboxypeptidase-like regulatory domain-containing protein [Microbacterium sp.]|uniref:carboxypeptidase-like regulatory domain-containing protein n=1 Tax=Microbacterium sp. TaxID=51671 RepID=UPI003A8B9610